MAERRMFSKKILESDAFLDMPLSTQALYIHLAMDADDDGFVNSPRKIQRAIGCNKNDLDLLIATGFVLSFDSGVVCIKHWRIHNKVRTDRYKPTAYQEELSYLNIKNNDVYTPNNGIPNDNQMTTNGIPNDNQMDTQGRLGKSSIGKYSIGEGGNNGVYNNTSAPPTEPPTLEQVIEYVRERGNKIDGEKFYDTYSANGWRTARGTQVADWKSAVRAWERTEYPDKQTRADTAQVPSGDAGSFETDSFFEAALARTYGEELVKGKKF